MATAFVSAEEGHWVNALPAVDINGAANTDVIDMRYHSHASIFITLGVTGAASTVTVTVCDDVTPSNETAIAFDYYAETTAAGDTLATRASATSAGFATSTNNGIMYVIELEASQLEAAVAGRGYFRVKFSDPSAATFVAVGVLLSGSRFAGDAASNPTAIV